MASVDVVPTMLKFAWKHGVPSVSRTHKRPCPIAREAPQKFWVVGKRSIPCYDSSPWNFYEPFVGFESGPDLVLCNDKNEIQVITPYTPASNGSGFSLLQIQHQNFVDIYELYSFEGGLFAISEYLDFSLKDLIEGSVCPTEPEIVCIISQVRCMSSFISYVLMQQVLTGIRFIWSRNLDHQLISVRNIRVSRSGNVKIGEESIQAILQN